MFFASLESTGTNLKERSKTNKNLNGSFVFAKELSSSSGLIAKVKTAKADTIKINLKAMVKPKAIDSTEIGKEKIKVLPYCEAKELIATINKLKKKKNLKKPTHCLNVLEAIIASRTESINASKNNGWKKSKAAVVIENTHTRMLIECNEWICELFCTKESFIAAP